MSTYDFRGIIPALPLPFRSDESVDEAALRGMVRWIAGHDGISALMTNGHTGEVFALLPEERAEVTRIVADEVRGSLPVISAVSCEGIREAEQHARMAAEAGASGIDVMPPHSWLRFGMKPEHVIDYFSAIHAAYGLDLVVHVYPAWTRASYTTDTLLALADLPAVKAFKIGTREMNKYGRDIRLMRERAPAKALLTCHDEYLLASMVQGVDGALVGFASFIPELITGLWRAVKAGRLHEAMRIQERINPLKDCVYGGGEPTSDAHARMKLAMFLAGRLSSAVVRPPIQAPSDAEKATIERALRDAGLSAAAQSAKRTGDQQATAS
jgi:4-hydroxy-tetrahydrodipicolinate synthase